MIENITSEQVWVFLGVCLVISLVCNGLVQATENGMILEEFKDYLGVKLPNWLFMPLLGCKYCMSSIYSILATGIYFIIYGFDISLVYLLPVTICCVCALNGIIYNLIND